MRHLVLLLFICNFFQPLNAQSADWKQIETPYLSNLTIRYQSKKGTLIAQSINNGKHYMSTDYGKSWKTLSMSSNENIIAYTENEANEIFYTPKNRVYKIDTTTYFSDFILQSISPVSLYYIQLLHNDAILVGTVASLELFDRKGVLIKRYVRAVNFPQLIQLPNQPNDILYLSGFLYSMNKNFEFNGDSTRITQFGFGNQFVKNKGRFFIGKSYSDDYGKTWNEIGDLKHIGQDSINFKIDHLNNLWFAYKDSIYFSKDNGESFKTIGSPINNPRFFFKNSQDIIEIKNDNCDNKKYKTLISNDEGKTWKDISDNINTSYANTLSVGINENLITSECNEIYTKPDINSNWQIATLPNPALPTLFTVKNDIYTKKDDTNHYYSKDRGKTWIKDYNLSSGSNKGDLVKGRDSFLYLYNSEQITYSHNAGGKWFVSKYNYLSPYFIKKIITKNLSSYYIKNINLFQSQIIRIKINSFGDEPIKINPVDSIRFVDMDSKFDSIVYAISYDYKKNNELSLYRIDDTKDTMLKEYTFSTTFTDRINAKIKIDYLGNMYVYDSYKLLFQKHESQNWEDITPTVPDFRNINDLQVSYDNYIYLATNGAGILKYNKRLTPFVSNLEEQKEGVSFALLSPNPVENTLKIKLLNNLNYDNGSIELYDTQGKKVLQTSILPYQEEQTISLEHLPVGLYFYTLSLGKYGTQSGKVVKM